MSTNCTGHHDGYGRCTECREVMFPHIYDRVQRQLHKPAQRDGLLPVGISRRKRERAM